MLCRLLTLLLLPIGLLAQHEEPAPMSLPQPTSSSLSQTQSKSPLLGVNLLDHPQLLAYYDFEGSSIQNKKSAESELPELGNARLEKGNLVLNGEYSGYKTNFYFYKEQLKADQDFSFSLNFQPSSFGTASKSNIISFGRSGRWMAIGRDKEDGSIVVSFRNGQQLRPFKNTRIEADEWYNLSIVFAPSKNQVQLFLNGHALPVVDLGRYLHGENAPTVDFSFCFYGNGNVFNGKVASIALFQGALTEGELMRLYPSLIEGVPGHMPTAVKATQHKVSGNFEYDVDEDWTYLPSCVEGDKGKEVLVTCPDGKQVTFSINHKKSNNTYVILRNSFSSIRNLSFSSFEAALQKTLSIAKEDC